MSNELTTLQSLVAQASRSLPAVTGECAAHAPQRRGQVILADVSASMVERACSLLPDGTQDGSGRRKIDVLRQALASVWRPGVRLIGFASLPAEVKSPTALPEPEGSTALHLAIEAAFGLAPRPRRIVVVTNGRPDHPQRTLDLVSRLQRSEGCIGRSCGGAPIRINAPILVTIDVIYCGSDCDREAIKFCESLATRGGGDLIVRDLARFASGWTPYEAIGHEIRRLLWCRGGLAD